MRSTPHRPRIRRQTVCAAPHAAAAIAPSDPILAGSQRRAGQGSSIREVTAFERYEGLTASYPRSVQLWLEYANAAADAGEVDLADQVYQRVLELEPTSADHLVEIGHVYKMLRRPEKALACFARAAALAPGAINPRISQAVLLERQHRLEEAHAAVEECLALDPRDEQARYFSAVLDRRAGNLEAAERTLRDLIGAPPAHPVVRHAARYELAQVLDQTQRPDEAMRRLRLAEAKQLSWAIADVHALITANTMAWPRFTAVCWARAAA